MKWFQAVSILPVVALGITAGTIPSPPVEASAEHTQLLNTEDKLFFTFSDWSYHVNAAVYGLAPYPSHITFQFVSAPESGPGDFAVWIESADGSVLTPFPGTFVWLPGAYQSSGYTGPVSVLYGSMDLSSQLAAELFGGGSALLVLENEGASVNVGLPTYSLAQDLSVTLSRPSLGVSAPVTDVKYQDPPPAAVSEPDSRWILPLCGVLLYVASRAANRIARR